MALATSSLPVPVSPWMSTVALVGAMLLSLLMTSCMLRAVADDALEAELLVELPLQLAVGAGQAQALGRLVHHGPQLGQVDRLVQVVGGALPASPRRRSCTSPWPVMTTTSASGSSCLALRRIARPSRSSIFRSVRMTSDSSLLDRLGAGRAAGGDDALVADALEALGHDLGVVGLVVDDEQLQAFARALFRGSLASSLHAPIPKSRSGEPSRTVPVARKPYRILLRRFPKFLSQPHTPQSSGCRFSSHLHEIGLKSQGFALARVVR